VASSEARLTVDLGDRAFSILITEKIRHAASFNRADGLTLVPRERVGHSPGFAANLIIVDLLNAVLYAMMNDPTRSVLLEMSG